MTIKDIINELRLNVLTGTDQLDNQVKGAYVSDLLSDVMGKAGNGELWITLHTHPNIVAVAALKELAAILIVNGGIPDNETINVAAKENIPILGTTERAFPICGRLYKIMEANAMVQG